MTSQPLSVQPPRLAFWLVNLCTIPDDAGSSRGDAAENSPALPPNPELLTLDAGIGDRL